MRRIVYNNILAVFHCGAQRPELFGMPHVLVHGEAQVVEIAEKNLSVNLLRMRLLLLAMK